MDKDYEERLIAMLANGYSQAQTQGALDSLGLPFSGEALEDAKALIRDPLDFYRSQPRKPDWFALFLDAYHAKLRQEIALFVAVGIDLEGHKEVLGFWPLQGRESKAFGVGVLQDLITRGVRRSGPPGRAFLPLPGGRGLRRGRGGEMPSPGAAGIQAAKAEP